MRRLILFLFLTTLSFAHNADAQLLSTRYYWSDSLHVTTTTIDCTFTERWDYVSFWADSCDIYYKAAAPDTNGITTRPRQLLYEGQVKSFGPATPLKRIIIYASSDSGTVWIEGYKRKRQ